MYCSTCIHSPGTPICGHPQQRSPLLWSHAFTEHNSVYLHLKYPSRGATPLNKTRFVIPQGWPYKGGTTVYMHYVVIIGCLQKKVTYHFIYYMCWPCTFSFTAEISWKKYVFIIMKLKGVTLGFPSSDSMTTVDAESKINTVWSECVWPGGAYYCPPSTADLGRANWRSRPKQLRHKA